MKNHSALFSVLPLVAAISLSAQAASHNKLVYIDEYDTNGDRAVSLREFDVIRAARFAYTDADGNGIVNEAEYVTEYQTRLNAKLGEERIGHIKQAFIRFGSLDEDDDKKITRTEMNASGERSFSRFDENKDGVINDKDTATTEFESEGTELTEEEEERLLNRQLASAKRLLSIPSTHSRHGMMRKYDTNKDGVITRKEFYTLREQSFTFTDTNKDGWLSDAEYIAEYAGRVDRNIAETREKQIKQTYVRFGVLDKNKNGEMTFGEYQSSGHNTFTRWDTDKDGYVSIDDPDPLPADERPGDAIAQQQRINRPVY